MAIPQKSAVFAKHLWCLFTGKFSLNVSVDSLFFIGSQLVALSQTGKVGVWHAMSQHWQVMSALTTTGVVAIIVISNVTLLSHTTGVATITVVNNVIYPTYEFLSFIIILFNLFIIHVAL